ncbi:MAG TPA: arsenite methyltransferase, partial [Candidatus Methanomethylicus sp.]|nr:arsenite methyltransferase [Candidatus Methanomethylicus sp.]
MKGESARKAVRKRYGSIARGEQSGCCSSSCCNTITPEEISKKIGYSDEDVNSIPEGANLGLGCGNPVALASLKEGEAVLDLGSGAGFDSFLASRRVGPKGRVIGVDMTPEMLERARKNAMNGGFENVEFRLGEIENLPVADNSIDVVISNCVINLSPEKERVFREAYRVLRPGGRIIVSDIVLLAPLPAFLKSTASLVACVGGAALKEEYLKAMEGAGFSCIKEIEESVYSIDSLIDLPEVKAAIGAGKVSVDQARGYAKNVVSMKVMAIK